MKTSQVGSITASIPVCAFLLAGVISSLGQPIITNQPQSLTNVVGTMALFSVGATGTAPLSFQWQHNSFPFVGQTNATLVVTNVQVAYAGDYSVVITNIEGGVTSAVATLTVIVPPRFTIQPASQSLSVGANATFVFAATGTAPLSYRLWFHGSALDEVTNSPSGSRASLDVTNAQSSSAGDYVVVVTNLGGAATSQVAHLDVDPTFTKIATGSIVTDVGTPIACAWGDYDGDGFLDLIVTGGYDDVNNIAQKNVLFHNNRDGTFTKVTNTVITAEAREWHGCSWVDYDNDGNLDLFITGNDNSGLPSQNELFRNNGDGTFTKMTSAQVGALVPGGGGSEGPVWADYDRDGFIDVYIARTGLDWLYHNNTDGTFTLIPNTNGIPINYENGFRATWADYNNDGWADLFVGVNTPNPCPHAFLYRGIGGGLFTNEVTSAIENVCTYSAAAWGDYDNDGYPDLLMSGAINHLFHNSQDGTFTEMTSNVVGSIVSSIPQLTDIAWGDYDNDGFLDVFMSVLGDPTNLATNRLYHNNGDGTFSQVLTGSPVNDRTVGGATCAWADYDNDGFLDLFVPCGAGIPATNLLYHNNGNSNAWLKIKLVGTASNRSAIGAKVRVQATIRGKSMWQLREVNTGSGLSGCPLEAHFGLGDATNIDQVRIEWPSGIVQTLTNVAPRKFMTVVEHQQTPSHTNRPSATVSLPGSGAVNLSATGDAGLLYVFEASTNLLNWTKIGVRSNATGQVSFMDQRTTNYARRYYRVSIP